jgi:hypothetical protein
VVHDATAPSFHHVKHPAQLPPLDQPRGKHGTKGPTVPGGTDDRRLDASPGLATPRRGQRTKNNGDTYDTITSDVHAASDHAAIYADIAWLQIRFALAELWKLAALMRDNAAPAVAS